MAVNRSPESKGIIAQIICVVESQFKSASALINFTSGNICHAKFYASEEMVLEKII